MNLNLKEHQNDVIFIPLGGSNEIGMNLNLYHYKGKWIMVDCGIGFAYDVPGIDMMTPDITFAKQIKKDLLCIIITHIHEDHIGAVQYLWEELNVEIYTTKLAKHFLIAKLQEFNLDKKVKINVIDSNEDLDLKPFKIEFLGLTHSVPEMKALLIKTDQGNILHTGDWKFDPNPVVGDISEKDKINHYGLEGKIDAIVCDSTNAINEGHSRSEGELYFSLKNIIEHRTGLVGVTTFASNIARIQTVAKIAKEVGRKVVLAGFSLNRIYEVAKKSGYFIEEIDCISDKEIKFYKKNEVLILCTGCQGEPMAATRKIAADNHNTIRFTKGDLMIFSSKIIPGNEKRIYDVFDIFAKRQIDVITEKDHFVHVSGHPYHDELVEMYQITQPKIAIPVHGEFIHTKVNGEIAKSQNVQKVIQPENGMAIKLDFLNPNNSQQVGTVNHGYLAVDGKHLISFESSVIKQRKKLSSCGIFIASLNLDQSLKFISKPYIKAVGSYDIDDDQYVKEIIYSEIYDMVKRKAKELKLHDNISIKFLKKKKKIDKEKIASEIERSLKALIGKIFLDIMDKKPYIDIKIWIS